MLKTIVKIKFILFNFFALVLAYLNEGFLLINILLNPNIFLHAHDEALPSLSIPLQFVNSTTLVVPLSLENIMFSSVQ